MDRETTTDSVWGLYAHVPFCERRCPYCDFTVAVLRTPPFDAYCAALADEIVQRTSGLQTPPRTVYFGGGTPGMLPPASLRLLEPALGPLLRDGGCEEFTVEFNPEHADVERLVAWRQLGADRISLGVQSLDAAALDFLGREHTVAQVYEAVDNARRAGFRRISIDLIFGLPGLPDAALPGLSELLAYSEIEHVSAYELTIERGTLFGALTTRGALSPNSEESTAEEWLRLRERLNACGFRRYEVSSYCRDGAYARHNSAYWFGRAYCGVGVGAHSLICDDEGWVRRENAPQLRAYLEAHRDGLPTPAHESRLPVAGYVEERVITALRTRFSFPIEDLRHALQRPLPYTRDTLASFANEGLVEVIDGHYCPREHALDLADACAVRVLQALERDLM